MSTDLDERCAQFWNWFASSESNVRTEFGTALAAKDYPAMQGLVEQLGGQLSMVAPGLSVRLSGGHTFTLAILAPEPTLATIAGRVIELAPKLDGWTFGGSIASPPVNVIVRDDRGRELTIPYADIRFALLPAKDDGTVSVMFVIDRDFDPQGDDGHLYLAVATEVVKNTFGAKPPSMGSFALVPTRWLADRETHPVNELAATWRKMRAPDDLR